MTTRERRGRRLEQLVDRALSELPLREAPASLERRVLAAIEHRTAPEGALVASDRRGRFGRVGFTGWSLAARAALLAACLASVAVVLLGLKELAARTAMLPADPSIAGRLQALRDAARATAALGALLARLIRMIPSEWLLGGLLAAVAVYSLVFALIAVGYSMLYATPERSGS